MSISMYYGALSDLHNLWADGFINEADFVVQRNLLARLRQSGDFDA